MIRPWVANVVIVAAVAVWVGNFVADVMLDYVANEAINGAFALLIGGVIALRSRNGNGNGK